MPFLIIGHAKNIALVGLCALALIGCASSPKTADSLLTPADRDIIAVATSDALEANKTGESLNWENETTGRSGNVTVTRTFTGETGRPCRDFQQTLAADSRTTIAYDSACRQADGAWISLNHANLSGAIAAAPINSKGGSYRAYRRAYPYYGPYYGPYHRYPGYYRYGYGVGPRYGFGLGYGTYY